MNESRTIERLPIDSSNLKAVGYDEARRVLSVEFVSGSIFHYYDVPITVFEEMGSAESRGAFYAKQIRGKFTGKPMTGLCPTCKAHGLIGEKCNSTTERGEACSSVVREIDRTHKG